MNILCCCVSKVVKANRSSLHLNSSEHSSSMRALSVCREELRGDNCCTVRHKMYSNGTCERFVLEVTESAMESKREILCCNSEHKLPISAVTLLVGKRCIVA